MWNDTVCVDDLLASQPSQVRMKGEERPLYQFKVTLQDVKPAVWRRIQTSVRYSFWDLHIAIQNAMGWNDTHLHEFRIPHPTTGQVESIGIPDDDDFMPEREVSHCRERSIADYFSPQNATARYVYDFGDDWNHDVVFEETIVGGERIEHPVCVDGKGACPPEDCGGPHGYAEFLRAIKKPGSPRGSELLAWVGGSFDPNGFNSRAVMFDDPDARWHWAFDESVLLGNDLSEMIASPRKADEHGRYAFQIPMAQYLALKHSAEIDVPLLEQFSAAVHKEDYAVVRLDIGEIRELQRCLQNMVKNLNRCLRRHILMSLREHFQTMESLIRRR